LLIKKFCAFYGAKRFIIAFERVCLRIAMLSWTIVTTESHILNLQIEETARKKKGKGGGKRTNTSSSCNTNLPNLTKCATKTI
jgi:hypothetical protein